MAKYLKRKEEWSSSIAAGCGGPRIYATLIVIYIYTVLFFDEAGCHHVRPPLAAGTGSRISCLNFLNDGSVRVSLCTHTVFHYLISKIQQSL